MGNVFDLLYHIHMNPDHVYPVHMSNFARFWSAVRVSSLSCVIINFLTDYDRKKLIMMQKLESTTVGLKPARFVHVDWVIVDIAVMFCYCADV